ILLSPSSRSFNKQGHCSTHFCLFFWREILHNGYLYIGSLPFYRCNQRSPFLGNCHTFHSPVAFIFTSRNHTAHHQMIEQSAGGRDRASQPFRHLLDGLLPLFIKDEQRGHVRQRIVKVLKPMHDCVDEVAESDTAELAEAASHHLAITLITQN